MASIEHSWLTPLDHMTLSNSDVHIWRATLDQPALRVQQLMQTLSNEERMRAERFHFEQDRKRFIVGHGVLRTILGLYLGTEPSQLQFCCGLYGKPYLSERYGEGKLQFNISHSHDLGIYAFTRSHEIGVDLEYIHYMPDTEQIAARFFFGI